MVLERWDLLGVIWEIIAKTVNSANNGGREVGSARRDMGDNSQNSGATFHEIYKLFATQDAFVFETEVFDRE